MEDIVKYVNYVMFSFNIRTGYDTVVLELQTYYG